MQSEIKVKVIFGEDIRRWHYPREERYKELISFVETLFFQRQKGKTDYYLQFEDGEMDKVSICNERDLLDAFQCAIDESRPSLKIFVIEGPVNDNYKKSESKEQICGEVKSEECKRKSVEACDDTSTRCPWIKEQMAKHANEPGEIHFGVQCDMCKESPIRGIRYKCGVCADYDLCEKCEALGEHDITHPLLKMARRGCRGDFVGLREIIGRSHYEWKIIPGFGCHRRRQSANACGMKKECAKQSKLQCRKEKLTRRLAKVNAKLSVVDEKEKKHIQEKNECDLSAMLCICGAPLIEATPWSAYYEGALVSCDLCRVNCSQDGMIYHCPAEKTKEHPQGYDVCLKCVEHYRMSRYQKPEKEAPPAKDEKIPVEKMKIEKEVDELDGFQYAKEAREIMNMGFTDITKIKYLLISKKGNADQVIEALLSQ